MTHSYGPPELVLPVLSAIGSVLAKHSKSFSLIDCISAAVDRLQRNFEPLLEAGGSLAAK